MGDIKPTQNTHEVVKLHPENKSKLLQRGENIQLQFLA